MDCQKNTEAIIPVKDVEMKNNNSLDQQSTESQAKIKLPELKYGYRTERCSWEELVEIMLVQNDVAKLSRSEEQQYQYEIYKGNILLQWSTMTDYVLHTKFPNVFTKVEGVSTVDTQQRRYKVDPPFTSISTTHISLTKNDFPYYMDEDIDHWVLWKLGGDIIVDSDIDHAKHELCSKHNMHRDCIIHWINPMELKSIPNIEHAHFLGRLVK